MAAGTRDKQWLKGKVPRGSAPCYGLGILGIRLLESEPTLQTVK